LELLGFEEGFDLDLDIPVGFAFGCLELWVCFLSGMGLRLLFLAIERNWLLSMVKSGEKTEVEISRGRAKADAAACFLEFDWSMPAKFSSSYPSRTVRIILFILLV